MPEAGLPWVGVAPGAPYFVAEHGEAWTPIGDNHSVSWPELAGLFRRRDLDGVDAFLAGLAAGGVTVLRLMLECAHGRYRYLERPTGRFVPSMVQLWDDLFALCARHRLRLLLTPYDTFWTWVRWRHHPLNRRNGGPCAGRQRLLLCPATREAVKGRLTFAVERWGGSGVVFAWDLWNEIHPAHAGGGPEVVEVIREFVTDLSDHVRTLEGRLYGRAHLQTVSVFGPELQRLPDLGHVIFRHPTLDVATTHVYRKGTVDHPRDTVAPALAMGDLVREALAETVGGRPYLDSEHGPIHSFNDLRTTLPEPFDDEYFRHIQWAHLASGGAGGGMRWPYRHPHVLTPGMRRAQAALAAFLPLVDWPRFRRRNLNAEATLTHPGCAAFACGDERQAVAWVLRTDALAHDGRVRRDAAPIAPRLGLPGLAPGRYAATAWDTRAGTEVAHLALTHDGWGPLEVPLPPFVADLALVARHGDGAAPTA